MRRQYRPCGPFAALARLFAGALAAICLAASASAQQPAQTGPDLREDIRTALRLYQAGRCQAALPYAERAEINIRSRLGPNHPDLVPAINIRALCLKTLGQYQLSEAAYRQTIELAERIHGLEAFEVAVPVDNLANLLYEQNRLTEAERLRRRALAIFLKVKGLESENTSTALQNLAVVLAGMGKHEESERLYRQALEISERLYAANHPQIGRLVDNLAGTVRHLGRLADAAPLYERAINIFRSSLGEEHPDTAIALQNHAILLTEIQEYDASERQLMRAIEINLRNYGETHPSMIYALRSLAENYMERGRWLDAAGALRRVANIFEERVRLGASERRANTSRRNNDNQALRHLVQALMLTSPNDAAAMDEAFRLAQTALSSETAVALAQMSARFSARDPRIGALLKARQDLYDLLETRRAELDSTAGRPANARNLQAEQQARIAIQTATARLTEIDQALQRDFPGFTQLTRPDALTIAETQSILRPGEALVMVLDIPSTSRVRARSAVFALTRERAHWAQIAMDSDALFLNGYALRCGLDSAHWDHPTCERVLKTKRSGDELPFDLERAHTLYKAILGPVEELIQGKELSIVLGGVLSRLPPHVLVRSAPDSAVPATDRFRRADWLLRHHPITVVPSVTSLKALRAVARASAATQRFIGFGNPLLVGADGNDRSAWSKLTCAQATPVAARKAPHVIAQLPGGSTILRSGRADLATIRHQTPLPETADELCAVAQTLGGTATSVRLGAEATEAAVKALSWRGELANYGILHFATHGLVAGNLPGIEEPALMLTPPDVSSDEDDGLLTASEITQLSLDADWVIMSACNTAASNDNSTDALSGLARAFFFAGARSLLVSHWAVNSDATVRLVTGAVAELTGSTGITKAEALRRAMAAMVDSDLEWETHPTYWAPFVLVGEGGGGLSQAAFAAPVAAAQPPQQPQRRRRPPTTGGSLSSDDWKSSVLRAGQ